MRERTVMMRNLVQCSSHGGWSVVARSREPVCETFESWAHHHVHDAHGVAAVPVDLQHRGEAVDHAFSRQEVGHVQLGAVHQQLRGEGNAGGQEERRSGGQEVTGSGGQE